MTSTKSEMFFLCSERKAQYLTHDLKIKNISFPHKTLKIANLCEECKSKFEIKPELSNEKYLLENNICQKCKLNLR